VSRPRPASAQPAATAGSRDRGPARGAFAALFAVTTLNLLAIGVTLPVVPRYVEGPLGAGSLAVGIVTGAFALSGIACRPLAGHFADRRGRRRAVVLGASLNALGGALHFLPAGVPGLIVARLFVGMGEGMAYTASSAWVIDLSPPSRHGRLIALYGLAVWFGVAFGAPIGELVLRAWGYEAVWACATAAPLLGAAIASRVPERRTARPRAALGLRTLIAREAVGPGLGLSLSMIGYATISAFLVLHLDAVGAGHAASAFTAFAAAVVLTRVLAGGLPDRFGPIPCVLAATLTEAAGLVLLAASGGLATALVASVLAGAGVSLVFPSLALIVVRRVGEERRGVAMGSYTAFFDLGFLVGSPVAGLAASLGGYRAAFATAAGAAVGAFALALALRARSMPEPGADAGARPVAAQNSRP